MIDRSWQKCHHEFILDTHMVPATNYITTPPPGGLWCQRCGFREAHILHDIERRQLRLI